jgi:hypothetical protein
MLNFNLVCTTIILDIVIQLVTYVYMEGWGTSRQHNNYYGVLIFTLSYVFCLVLSFWSVALEGQN